MRQLPLYNESGAAITQRRMIALNPRQLLFYNESGAAINQSVGAPRKLMNPAVPDIVEVKAMRKERTQRIRDDLDGQSMSVEEALISYILLYDQICCKMNPS